MAEIHKEFLASWDGRVLPKAWLEHWLKHGDHLEDCSRKEYRGGEGVRVPSPRVLAVAGSGVCEPDRFGPDNREERGVRRHVCTTRLHRLLLLRRGASARLPRDSHRGAFALATERSCSVLIGRWRTL